MDLGLDASQEINQVKLQPGNAGSFEIDELHDAGIRCVVP